VCLALAEQGSKAAAHLLATSKLVPSNANGGFRLNNETGHAIVEMRRDDVTKEWSWWATDSTHFNDRVNLCFAFDNPKTMVPPTMLSNNPKDDALHCHYDAKGRWGYTKYMFQQDDSSQKITGFMQPQEKVPGIISKCKFLQP